MKKPEAKSSKTKPESVWDADEIQLVLMRLLKTASPGRVLAADSTPRKLSEILTALSERKRKADWDQIKAVLNSLILLFKLWRGRISTLYGKDFWAVPEAEFKADSRTMAWLGMLRAVTSSHRKDALESLLGVAKDGMSWTIASGRTKKERYPDFGYTQLRLIADRIEAELRLNKAQEAADRIDKETQTPAPLGSQGKPKTVRMVPRGRQLQLRFGDNEAVVGGKVKDLILHLQLGDPHCRFQQLWNQLWPSDPYITEKSGPPARLRDLCRRARKLLLQNLGPAPGSGEWIGADKGYGYRLTTAVVWRLKLPGLGPGELSVDPRTLDT